MPGGRSVNGGRTVRRLVLAFLLATSAGTAHAQLGNGQSGSSTTTYIGQDEALEALVWFGRCYGKQYQKQALALMATVPGSNAERALVRKLFRGSSMSCMASDTTVNGVPIPYIRGVIAEGLLRAGAPLPASHKVRPLVAANVRSLSDAARCYAPSNRAGVAQLLETRPGSRQEADLVRGMIERFVDCIPATRGEEYYPTLIRFRLAEALLRLEPEAPAG